MHSPDINAYLGVMEEIKCRTDVVVALLNNKTLLPFKIPQIECIALQIRMMLELVALSSLAANRAIFEVNRLKFQKHWNPTDILRDVAKINPRFYPQPVREVPSERPGVQNDLVALENGFLTQSDLVEIHGRLGNLLHARNPFGKGVDPDLYAKEIPQWLDRIVHLLNVHLIYLLDDDRMYLVQMRGGKDSKVNMYTFEKVE